MKKFNLGILVVGAMLLQACGSNTTRNVDTTSSNSNTNNNNNNGGGTQTGNVYNLPQAPEQEIQMSGDGGPVPPGTISVNASTSRTLKIKITPQAAPHLTIAPYTNWVFPYGCLRVTVKVNGTSKSTQLLKVGGVQQGANSACKDAPTSQVLDFSNAMTGSGSVSITFTSPQYDNCRSYYPLYYGCQTSAVWQNHMVAFDVATQVDGTYLE